MKQGFYEFCDIIKKLRAPDGCPWDREQTHKTLAKHLLEESYEAYDAVMENDRDKTVDELGDVLLQIVMHAEIGSEAGEFDIEDIISNVKEKMIVRHPHVFGDVQAKTPEQVLNNWEEIKKNQRGQKKVFESMQSITPSLPALTKCCKVIGKAAKLNVLEKTDKKVTKEQIGDELFEICLIAHQNGIEPEEALYDKIKNFIKKIKNIEENT